MYLVLVLFSTTSLVIVQGFEVTNTFNVVQPNPSNPNTSITFNRLSVLLSSSDGALGFNNRRNINFQVDMVNSNNQMFTSTVNIAYQDVTPVYQQYVLGYAAENVIPPTAIQCQDRTQNFEQATGAFGTPAGSPVTTSSGGGATGNGLNVAPITPQAARAHAGVLSRKGRGSNKKAAYIHGLSPPGHAKGVYSQNYMEERTLHYLQHDRRLLLDSGETPLKLPSNSSVLAALLLTSQMDNNTATGIAAAVTGDIPSLATISTDWLAQLNAQNITVTNALTAYENLGAVLYSEFTNYSTSFNISLQYAESLEIQLSSLLNQTSQTLNASYSQALSNLQGMNNAVEAIALTSSNETQVFATIASQRANLQATSQAFLTTFQNQLQILLQSARFFDGNSSRGAAAPPRTSCFALLCLCLLIILFEIGFLTDAIEQNTARAQSVATQQLQRNTILNLTAGTMQPIISQTNTYVNGLGFVPFHPGDNRYVVRITIIFNTVNDPTLPQPLADPDIELLNPSIPADQIKLNKYQAQLASAQSTGYRYAHLRNIYLICSDDFLLVDRSMWLTFYDLKTFIAKNPNGCVPGVSGTCTCTYTIGRERCASNMTFVNTQSFVTMAGTGICVNQAELNGVWYNTNLPSQIGAVDNSITGLFAAENDTSNDPFDAELSRMCRTPLTVGTEFGVATSTFSTQFGTPGIPLLTQNNIAACSTNYYQMQVDSTLNGITLPYMINTAMNVASKDLYQTVSTQWVIDQQGVEGVGVRHEQVPYFVRGPFVQPNTTYWRTLMNLGIGPNSPEAQSVGTPVPVPIISTCDVAITGYASTTSVPVRVLILDHIEQIVNITVTNDAGNIVLQQQQIQVSMQNDPQNTLPDIIYLAGYSDCIAEPCLFVDGTTRRLVYDIEDGGLTGAPSVFERYGNVDYYMRRYISNSSMLSLPQTPEGNFVNHVPTIGLDQFMTQEGLLTFDPTGIADTLANKMRALIPDPDPLHGGGYLCDPNTPAVTVAQNIVEVDGTACSLHKIARFEPQVISPFPTYDSTPTAKLPLKVWGPSLMYFDIPATSVTELVQTTLTCPNPEQVQILLSSPLAPQLSIQNQFGFTLNVSIQVVTIPVSPPPIFNTTVSCSINRIVSITSQQTLVISLLSLLKCPPVQSIVIKVNQTVGSGAQAVTTLTNCWSFSGNMTLLRQEYLQQQGLIQSPISTNAAAANIGNTTLAGVNQTALYDSTGLGQVNNGTGTFAAASNLNLANINRLTANTQSTTNTFGTSLATMAALTLASNNNINANNQLIANRVQAHINYTVSQGNPVPQSAATIPWNASALAEIKSLVVKAQTDHAIFQSLIQTAGVIGKANAAILSSEQTALSNNISALINAVIAQSNAANAYASGVTVSEAQATNLTELIKASQTIINGYYNQINTNIKALNALANATRGCPPATEFGSISNPAYWATTKFVAETFSDLLRIGGNDIVRGGQAVAHVAGLVLGQLYSPNCNLFIPILCSIENDITEIIGVIITVVVILLIIYGIYFCFKFKKAYSDATGSSKK